MPQHAHKRLEAPPHPGSVRLLTGLHVSLSEGQRTSVVTITRTGTFTDPRYGQFEITPRLLQGMVSNFQRGTYGQDIFLDVAHLPSNGAAAKVLDLFTEGSRLRARVEWTPYGTDAVTQRGYRYLSAEYVEDFVDNETGQRHGPVLLGAGLTVRPVIKRLDPVQLSEADHPTLIHPELLKTLSQEAQNTMEKWLKKLRARLQARKLSEDTITSLMAAAEQAAKALGEDETALNTLADRFDDTAKQLAEATATGGQPVQLSITLPEPGKGQAQGDNKPPQGAAPKALSEEDVRRILAAEREAASQAAKQLAETLENNQNLFDQVLTEAKGLDEDTRQALSDARDLVTADMTTDQVRKLAEHQVATGNRIMAARQLSSMGYGSPAGQVSITPGQDTDALRLQQEIDKGLRNSLSFANHQVRAPEKTSGFVSRVLAEFDRTHARRLSEEARALSGETNIGHTDLPVGFQRTVIREALHDLNILQLVQTLTDPSATMTTQVPYEQRDTSEVVNDGIVFEGHGIPRAGVRQMMDIAYVLAMKLSLKLTNEVMHFTRSSQINWDAYARNVESNARVMRELVSRRIANDMQRAADAYLAANVADESIATQLDGATHTIKTVEFPLVRPHQRYDMQGNAVGNPDNPITIALGATEVPAWDGSGDQDPGTYYRVKNFNLGYIQFVDEDGVPVTPDEATATISYSYATNLVKWDSDVPNGEKQEVHLNRLLQRIGARKATLSSDRFIQPNFLLMSPILNDMCTNAEQFALHSQRSGSDTDATGDLERVKGLPAWGTNAPGIDLGDERILMGQRGTTTYTVAKPFGTGTPFEAVDAQGRPTGEKVAYGEEYNAIHTPAPIRNRYTSVLVYSAGNR